MLSLHKAIGRNMNKVLNTTTLRLKGKPLASAAIGLSKEQQQEKMKNISLDVNVRYAEAFQKLAE